MFWEILLGNYTTDICVSVVLAKHNRMQLALPELMLDRAPQFSDIDHQSFLLSK